MPSKRKTRAVSRTELRAKDKEMNTSFTLAKACETIDDLANADNSKLSWKNSLITLTHYYQAGEGAFASTMTKNEMFEEYQDINIYPIITDYDFVTDALDNKIMSTRSGTNIAPDTKKQYYVAIIRLTHAKSPCQIPKTTRDKYVEKLREVEKMSNNKRNQNEPIRANAMYPNFKWNDAVNDYEKFVAETPFTNTSKGLKDIRVACAVGLYIWQRPRRVQDYATLQWFSKKPTEREMEERNILYADDDKLYLSIDKFKTRYRVAGAAKEKKELLPRYEKEMNPRLADLFKDYIKKAKIKDMAKLTPAEKRQGKNYYVFVKEGDDTHETPYDDNSFSKVLTAAFKYVFKKPKLSVNTFRHMYNTYISENINQFTDAQLQQISIDVGDTPRNMATNLRYRIADQGNKDMEKTEIEGQIADNEYAKNLMDAEAEQGESVQNVAQDDGEEVVSPSPAIAQTPKPPMTAHDEDLAVLYQRLGEAHMQVKLLESLIAKKLSI